MMENLARMSCLNDDRDNGGASGGEQVGRQRQRAGGGTEEKKIAGEGLGKWWNGGGRKREKGREV